MKPGNYKLKILLLILISFKLQAQTNVNFMSMNVWQEGTSVPNGLNKIRDVIVKVNPDIMGFAEVRNYTGDWTTKIVNALSAVGKTYYRGYAGGDVAIISKYPIVSSYAINTATGGMGSVIAFNININGNTIIVTMVHLDYTGYACYLPRGYNGGTPDFSMIDDGTGNPKPVTDVNAILSYNLTSQRDEQIAAFVNYVKTKTQPLILMGDFNEPSCLDWTASISTMFDHHGLTIPWQTTLTLKNNGFTDCYREFFPDPAANPGISWPSYANDVGVTSWTPKSDERDRIDFIFHKGDQIKTKYMSLVGPKPSYAKNVLTTSFTAKENFMADSLPWPSDHKAMFATITFPFTSVGITENSFMDNLVIFPNPAQDKIRIQTNEKIQRAIAIDAKGAEHLLPFQNGYYDVGNLRQGVYVLKLAVQENIYVSKLVLIK